MSELLFKACPPFTLYRRTTRVLLEALRSQQSREFGAVVCAVSGGGRRGSHPRLAFEHLTLKNPGKKVGLQETTIARDVTWALGLPSQVKWNSRGAVM